MERQKIMYRSPNFLPVVVGFVACLLLESCSGSNKEMLTLNDMILVPDGTEQEDTDTANIQRSLNQLRTTGNCPGCDFRNAKLKGEDFKDADLCGADFTHADLRNANFRNANLNGADFTFAELRKADFRGSSLLNADFFFPEDQLKTANLRNAIWTGGETCLSRDCSKRDEETIVWQDAKQLWETGNCPDCDLSGAYLDFAELNGANLSNANLCGATLDIAKLNNADLSNANLCGASLSLAKFNNANLSNANLTGADINFDQLGGADLTNATWIDGMKCIDRGCVQRE